MDAVKAAACENLYLFIQINEDEFEKYLKTFAQDVWTELTKVSLNPSQVSCSPLKNATASNSACSSSFIAPAAGGALATAAAFTAVDRGANGQCTSWQNYGQAAEPVLDATASAETTACYRRTTWQ